ALTVQNGFVVTDVFSLSPEFDSNGLLLAYRLRPGRHGRVFARWGLQAGDRVIAIEGAPLGDVDAASQMLELISRGQNVNITVVRDGVRVSVVLDQSVLQDEKNRAEEATENLITARIE
ncbi:MAG: PDZ domain-containing protein, partial [Candidatus Binatia bacterium]